MVDGYDASLTGLASLYCLEPVGLRRAFEDHVLLDDERVLQNLLTAEDTCLPNSTYFSFQPEIKPSMRRTLANWMLELCEEQLCEEDVFVVAMNYLDRFLSVVPVAKNNLQLLGTACLFIASKLKETITFTADKLVVYTDRSITVGQLLEWELLVLQVLKWDVSVVTPHDFLGHIFIRLHELNDDNMQKQKIRRHAQTFIALCATEFTFASYPSSMIAASSVVAAVHGLLGKTWSEQIRLVEQLQRITSIDADCLRGCHEQIEQVFALTATGASVIAKNDTSYATVSPHGKCAAPATPTDVMDISLNSSYKD